MAFIDVVEWSPQDSKTYAYRFPHNNLSTGTQLIVHESQEAVFFSKGAIIGKFGPGAHTLSTQNIPLLRNLFGIPFGGRNPFTAEVWFVNKTAPLNINWTTTPMRIMDPDYGQMLPIVSTGRYGLRVKDAERFLVKLVGTMQSFTSAQLTEHFKGEMISRTNSSIAGFMNVNRVGINSVAMHLADLSDFIKQPMAEFWEDYGMALEGFYITEVSLDTSTPEGRKISEAMADRSAQAIAGYTWQQEQSFKVAGSAANTGSSMGILGAAMMTGAFGNKNNNAAMMQTPPQNQYQFGNQGGQLFRLYPLHHLRREPRAEQCGYGQHLLEVRHAAATRIEVLPQLRHQNPVLSGGHHEKKPIFHSEACAVYRRRRRFDNRVVSRRLGADL